MENKKFLKDISASGVQVIVTQLANLIIFYLISKYVSKEDFGFYNWSVAICSTLITICSFGIDLVYVKRIASGIKEKTTIGLHFFHSLLTTSILIVLGIVITNIFPDIVRSKDIFVLILINQSIFYIVNSIRLCLNGYEQYNVLAKVSIITSILRTISIVALLYFGIFTIENIIFLFITNYIIEFIISYKLSHNYLEYYIKPTFEKVEYKSLLKESLPQLGTVIFDSALARLDWIIMGIIATSVKTAEYTFAFKIFEISKLPYLIIAPILLTRFSKLFKDGNLITNDDKKGLDNLFKVEMFIAFIIPMVAIVIWSDFFDLITDGKYGESTETTYLLLALCIPLQFAINFLWTMAFTQGQLKQILHITIITAIINVILNVILISKYNSNGAAIAFLASSIIQITLYYFITNQTRYKLKINTLLLSMILACLIINLVFWLEIHFIIRALIAVISFIIIARLTNLISLKILKSTSI